MTKRYWVNVVTADHVAVGQAGGFTQADHGAKTKLSKLSPGDELVFYSPRTHFEGGKPLQQFVARITVTGDEPYQVNMTDDFHPWRMDADFHDVTPVAAKAILDQLSFIKDKTHWGLPFRRSLFEIPEADFEVIAAAMNSKA